MTTNDSETVVRFENVGLRYGLGPEVLQDVTFSLAAGSFHFLVGDSGAGKSSLLKLIYLALKPSRGLISLFGRDIATTPRRELPAMRRRVGVVFQEFRLLNHLSAFDNVALPLMIASHRRRELERRVRAALDQVGLLEYEKHSPLSLSTGEQQRVGIARAVASRPELVIADEPTGNLDPDLSLDIMRLFERFNKVGVTLLIATHDLELIDKLQHRRLRLDHGKVVDESE